MRKRTKQVLLIVAFIVLSMAVADRYARGQGGEGPSGSFGHIIKNDGIVQPQRQFLDFKTGVNCADNPDPGVLATECTGTGGVGGGHEIKDGTATVFPNEPVLKFLGGATVSAETGETIVTTHDVPSQFTRTDHSQFDAEVSGVQDVSDNTADRHLFFDPDVNPIVDHANFQTHVSANTDVAANKAASHPVFVPELNTADDHGNFASEVAALTSIPGQAGEVLLSDGAGGTNTDILKLIDGSTTELEIGNASKVGSISTSHSTNPLLITNHLAGGVDLQAGATIGGQVICYDGGPGCTTPPNGVAGAYDAATNTPTLVVGTSGPGSCSDAGDTDAYADGQYLIVTDAGTQIGFDWLPGDWPICTGTATGWAKVPNVTNAAGAEGQLQTNSGGALGAVASGTVDQVLKSAGSGSPPTWADQFVPESDPELDHIGFDTAVSNSTDVFANTGQRHAEFLPKANPASDHSSFISDVTAIADVLSNEGFGTTTNGQGACFADANGKRLRGCIADTRAGLRVEIDENGAVAADGVVPFNATLLSVGDAESPLLNTTDEPGRITFRKAGLYEITGALGFIPDAGDDCREWEVFHQGVTSVSNVGYGGTLTIGGQSQISTYQPVITGFGIFEVGEYIELKTLACPTLNGTGDFTGESSYLQVRYESVDGEGAGGGGGGGSTPVGPENSIQTSVGGSMLGFADLTFTDVDNCLAVGGASTICHQTDLTISNSAGKVTVEDIDFAGDASIRLPSAAATATLTVSNDFADGTVDVDGVVHDNGNLSLPGTLDVQGSPSSIAPGVTVGNVVFDDSGSGGETPTLTTLAIADTAASGLPTTPCTTSEYGDIAYVKNNTTALLAIRFPMFVCSDLGWRAYAPAPIVALFQSSHTDKALMIPASTWVSTTFIGSIFFTAIRNATVTYGGDTSGTFYSKSNSDQGPAFDQLGERMIYTGHSAVFTVGVTCGSQQHGNGGATDRGVVIWHTEGFHVVNSVHLPSGTQGSLTAQGGPTAQRIITLNTNDSFHIRLRWQQLNAADNYVTGTCYTTLEEVIGTAG